MQRLQRREQIDTDRGYPMDKVSDEIYRDSVKVNIYSTNISANKHLKCGRILSYYINNCP
jgi:hypothetical protein